MAKPKIDPSAVDAALVRRLLDYEPETGIFRWCINRGGTALAGTVAGSVDAYGYILLRIGNRNFKAHRVAWLHTFGQWPTDIIDHINGVRADNRLENLRDVTHSQNLLNTKLATHNTSGTSGVRWDKRRCKWVAFIQIAGKFRHLGRYSSKEEAIAARLAAAQQHVGGITRAASRR